MPEQSRRKPGQPADAATGDAKSQPLQAPDDQQSDAGPERKTSGRKRDQEGDSARKVDERTEELADEALAGQGLARPVAEHYGQSVQDDVDRALSQPPPPKQPIQALHEKEVVEREAAEKEQRDRDGDGDVDGDDEDPDSRIGQRVPEGTRRIGIGGHQYEAEDGRITKRVN